MDEIRDVWIDRLIILYTYSSNLTFLVGPLLFGGLEGGLVAAEEPLPGKKSSFINNLFPLLLASGHWPLAVPKTPMVLPIRFVPCHHP